MPRFSINPYKVRDSAKYLKNVRKKIVNNKLTISSISQKYKVLHYASCVGYDTQKIIDFFNSKISCIYSYYKYCDQFYRLSQIFSILKWSCLKTLANKYKCGSVSILFKKFGVKLEKISNRSITKISTNTVPVQEYLKNKKNKLIDDYIYENFEKNLNSI